MAYSFEPEDIPSMVSESTRARLGLVRFEDIRPGKEPPYLIKGLVPAEGLTVIWGPPKCGKSFWTFDTVMHIALDWTYRGHKVKSGPD